MNGSVIALGSIVGGALVGGIVRVVVDQHTARMESRGVAIALQAEVSALVLLVEQRQYFAAIAAVVARLEDPAHAPTAEDLLAVHITQNYFAVFGAIAPRIGLLGSLSGPVVSFYSLAKAVVEDLMELREAHDDALAKGRAVSREFALSKTLEFRGLLEATVRAARELIAALVAFENRAWFRPAP